MWDKVLEIAGHIPHPWTVAVVVSCIAAGCLVYALLSRSSRVPRPAWILLAVVIAALGLAPISASHFLQSRGAYRIRILVMRPDRSLVDSALVKTVNAGELKMVFGGWQLDVPPQVRPAEGTVTLSALVKDEFLKGKSTLILADDYYPTVTIHLIPETAAMIRGVVVDEDLRAIAGATVSIPGYDDKAVTDNMGNFELPAHAGNGQVIELRAKKNQMAGHLSARAGKVVEIVMSQE
jgi:hypothetical protein